MTSDLHPTPLPASEAPTNPTSGIDSKPSETKRIARTAIRWVPGRGAGSRASEARVRAEARLWVRADTTSMTVTVASWINESAAATGRSRKLTAC